MELETKSVLELKGIFYDLVNQVTVHQNEINRLSGAIATVNETIARKSGAPQPPPHVSEPLAEVTTQPAIPTEPAQA